MPGTETSPIYSLPIWAGPQAAPWVVENTVARSLEAVGRGQVSDRDLADAPAVCADGECFLVEVGSTPGDPWDGHAGEMAVAVGVDAGNGWLFVAIGTEGQILWVVDEATRIQFVGGIWVTFPDAGSLFQTSVVAAEAIADGDLVNVYDDAGTPKVRLADATDPAKFANAFALSTVALDDPCTIQSTGINKQVAPAQSGEVWLSEITPGAYEFAPPAVAGEIVQSIGTAIEAIGILFNPGPRIEL